MNEITPALQQLLMDHLAPIQLLMANLPLGGTMVSVANSSRYRVGDDVFIASDTAPDPSGSPGLVEECRIKSIPDYNLIELAAPITRAWTMAESAYILGAVNHIPLKRVYIGNLPALADYPCITIQGKDEDEEWITLGATTHQYKYSIKAFVLADNAEMSELFLPKFCKKIREILTDHIHPIVNGVSVPLTSDVPAGATVVSIGSTANITIPALAFIRDAKTRTPAQESTISSILSPTDVQVVMPLQYDYKVARGAEMILMSRYFYDTRASSISYGYTKKEAGMLRGGDISYYLKEELIRLGNILT